MKRSSSATSRRRAGGAASISLFPFLAVLLCTMGSLTVILVVIARHARVQAEQIPIVAEKSQALKDMESARDMARWRISELKTSREKTEAQLADIRLQLGGIEDHSRKLHERLAQLKTAFAQLESTKSGSTQQRAQLQSDLARLRGQIEDAKKQLAKTEENAKKRGSYAVIPYEGPNGTHRRPLYLECRYDGVVLQPEGLTFTGADFDGPLGPGNPLDVALRAAREYQLERKRLASDGSDEPYPLLLVRPSGIDAYYAAQAAMKSWASEFGYELIGEDWKLEFQPPDPVLADKVKQVVDIARVRQQRLAQAVPRHYDSRSRPTYRAAPYRGGVVRDSSEEKTAGSGLQARQPAGRFGSRVGGDSLNPATGSAQPQDAGLAGSHLGENASAGDPPFPPERPINRNHPLRGDRTMQPPREGQTAKQGGTPARLGEWTPQPPSDKNAKPPRDDQGSSQAPCLAETRGKDWGLRDAAGGSVPITRPIRINLYADRLVIVPEQGTSEPKVIPLGARTVDAIDGTVSALWDQMDSWGIAGRGMYWRPVLNVYVAPDADSRYADLANLLDGSGLEVQRK